MNWLIAGALATTTPIPPPTTIAHLARDAMQRTQANGLAIAIVDRGRVVSAQAFGARNAAGDPLTTSTVMYGASLTKAVFGYYVAMLAAGRRVDLDRPIAAMLPRALPDYGNLDAYGNWGDLAGDDRWRRVTPRNVLNHATGFANFSFAEPDGKLRFHFDPGTRYAYSGEGMLLLQFGLEAGLGLDVGADIARRILTPAGTTRTALTWRSGFATDLADGWKADGSVEPHDERGRVRVAGSMDTTILDMARIAAFMVRGDGRPLPGWSTGTLPITSRAQFPSLAPEAPAADRFPIAAGLGVVAFDGPQGPGWFKGGHNDSTANMLVCLTRRQRCAVVLSNDVRTEAAFPALVDALLGTTGVAWRWEYPDHVK